MQYALIVNDEVRELFAEPPVFHPSLEIAEVDDDVEVYFVRVGDSYVPPSSPFAQPEYPSPWAAEMQSLLDRIEALEAKLGTGT